MTYLFLYINFICITFAVFNSYIILWGLEKFDAKKRKRYSKIWHKISWFLRLEIALLMLYLMLGKIQFEFSWFLILFWGVVFLNVNSTIYDLTINVIRKLEANQCSIWYIDNKGTNAIFLKIFGKMGTWIFRAILIITNILIILI